MTRPFLRMTLHLSHIFFTLAMTFIYALLVPVDDAPTTEVIRRKLDDDPVVRENSYVVHSHLSADVCKDFVPIVEFDSKHCVRKALNYRSLQLDRAVFLGHTSHKLVQSVLQAGLFDRR